MGKIPDRIKKLNRSQISAIINASMVKVQLTDAAKKVLLRCVIWSLVAWPVFSIPEEVFGEAVMLGLRALVVLSFVYVVFMFYKLANCFIHWRQLVALAKSMGCEPGEYSTQEVLVYMIKPLIDSGDWTVESGPFYLA